MVLKVCLKHAGFPDCLLLERYVRFFLVTFFFLLLAVRMFSGLLEIR